MATVYQTDRGRTASQQLLIMTTLLFLFTLSTQAENVSIKQQNTDTSTPTDVELPHNNC